MSGIGPNDVSTGGDREDGGAFEHSAPPATPGEGKPPAPDGGEGGTGKLAGKFETPEDLEKAYLELQSQFTKSRQAGGDSGSESGEASKGDSPGESTGDGTIAGARKAAEAKAEKAGIDLDAINAEYAEHGKLSDETYETLTKAGLNKQAVDQMIEGAKALTQRAVDRIQGLAGSAEAMQATLEWAGENLTDAEIAAYDTALRENLDVAESLFRGIMAKRAAVVGSDGVDVDGERSGGPAGVKPFRSFKDVSVAMADPRYAKEEAYREEVARRLEASNI